MTRFLIAGALALAVAGCATLLSVGDRAAAREVLVGCTSISHTVEVLTPNKAKLGSGAVSLVDHAINTGEPICTASEPPENARATIRDLLMQISNIEVPKDDPQALDPTILTIGLQVGLRLIDFGITIAELYSDDTDADDIRALWSESVPRWRAAAAAWRGA